MINVILVEPQGLFRKGCEYLLASHPTIQLQGAFETEKSLTKNVLDISSGAVICILSRNLSDACLISVIKRLKRSGPELKVLILEEEECLWSAERYRLAGADGYLAKTATEETFIAALQQLWKHWPVWPEGLLQWQNNDTFEAFGALTEREMEILDLILKGKSPKIIGTILHLSPKTVSTYKARIFEKLGLTTMMDVFTVGVKLGLINADNVTSTVELGMEALTQYLGPKKPRLQSQLAIEES